MSNLINEQPPSPAMQIAYLDDTLKRVKVILEVPVWSQVYFDTANHNVTGTNRDWRHYLGQCEYFAVYCADLGQVYLVPVDQVGRTRAHLRIEPTKNNQEKNVRWAKDYKL